MEDTLRLTTDPGNSFDVLARLGTGYDRLGASGARVGDGFVRGERVVRTATGNITASLLTAQSGADAAVIAFQSLERVFAIGLPATIGVAAAIAAVAKFREETEKTKKAVEEFDKAVNIPIKISAGLSASTLTANIIAAGKATEDLEGRFNSISEILRRMRPQDIGLKAILGAPEVSFEDIQRGVSEQVRLGKDLVAITQKDTDIKALSLGKDKDAVALAQSKLKYERDRIELLSNARTNPSLISAVPGLIADLQRERDIRDQLINQAKAERDAEAQVAKETERATFLQSVGSGQFIKDLEKQRQIEQQVLFAKQQIAELSKAATAGTPLGPNAQGIVDKAKAEGLIPDENAPVGPIPGGRTAGVGESQDLVNQIEKNKQAFDAFNPTIDEASKQMQQINSDSTLSPDDMKRMMDTGDESGTTVDANRELESAANEAAQSLSNLANLDFQGIMSLNGLVISIQ